MIIRETEQRDIAVLQIILDETGLFPAELLPDMISGFLSPDETPDIWLTCELDSRAIGFCYAMPETLAEGTWNMLAIAVLPQAQGKGAGNTLVKALETKLKNAGQRVIIADTSGTSAYDKTRAFYRGANYTEEARIRDFWAKGDDKVVFWKSLIA